VLVVPLGPRRRHGTVRHYCCRHPVGRRAAAGVAVPLLRPAGFCPTPDTTDTTPGFAGFLALGGGTVGGSVGRRFGGLWPGGLLGHAGSVGTVGSAVRVRGRVQDERPGRLAP